MRCYKMQKATTEKVQERKMDVREKDNKQRLGPGWIEKEEYISSCNVKQSQTEAVG